MPMRRGHAWSGLLFLPFLLPVLIPVTGMIWAACTAWAIPVLLLGSGRIPGLLVPSRDAAARVVARIQLENVLLGWVWLVAFLFLEDAGVLGRPGFTVTRRAVDLVFLGGHLAYRPFTFHRGLGREGVTPPRWGWPWFLALVLSELPLLALLASQLADSRWAPGTSWFG